PPEGPRARAPAGGVSAEASPPRAGSEGCFAAAGGPRGRRDRRPPQLPRAPAANGGTRRPTERAWSEDREPGAAPPPPARTVPSSGYRFAAESFSQSLAAIVSSGPNRATRASWRSAALPTTPLARGRVAPEIALDRERQGERLGRGRRLGERAETEVAAREPRHERAPRRVGEAPLDAQLLDQLRGEAAAEDGVGDDGGDVARVAARNRDVAEPDLGLG